MNREVVFANLAFFLMLLAGIATAMPEVRRRRGLSMLLPLSLPCAAAALAAFGVQHFYEATPISAMVPSYFPFRHAIAFGVGFLLFAAALSFVARRCLQWSLLLLSIMLACFVILIHIPNAVHEPHNNGVWMVLFRDTGFAVGALAYAAILRSPRAARAVASPARILCALILFIFAINNFAHIHLMGGVPLDEMPPPWFHGTEIVTLISGAILLAVSLGMLFRRHAFRAALYAGAFFIAITLIPYTLILLRSPFQSMDPIDFVADTLFFGAAVLWVAAALEPGARMFHSSTASPVTLHPASVSSRPASA